jgi:IclR family KDG regulon transcriptional repressor
MKSDNSASRSVSRISSLLKCFTQGEPELGISEISRKIGLPKSTIHRILSALAKEGFIVRNEETEKYTIGPELYIMGSIYASVTNILTAARPVMKVMNELSGEAVVLSVLDNNRYVRIITYEQPEYYFRYAVPIGHMRPAYASAMGRAMLSDLSNEEIDRLFPEEKLKPVTEKSVSTKKELKRLLGQIRRTGISYNPEGIHRGIYGIAAAIRDNNGSAVAAMSLPVPVFMLNPTRRTVLSNLARFGTRIVSYRLGYQDANTSIRSIEDLRSWWRKTQVKYSFSDKVTF